MRLHPEDYLFNGWEDMYDGVICNPPYASFWCFKKKDYALEEIQSHMGINLSGLSNTYVLFILKSLYQLGKNGRAAYIIPAEFLNADYGKEVKEYIVKSRMLKNIIKFKDNTGIFKSALTTTCILLFSMENNSEPVELIKLDNPEKLGELTVGAAAPVNGREGKSILNPESHNRTIKKVITADKLIPDEKWRVYFYTKSGTRYKNLAPFSRYARAVRGIATGSNSYFIFNKTKQAKYGIPDRFFMPCISKSYMADIPFFTEEQYAKLLDSGKNILLFNGQKNNEEHVKKYIKTGEDGEINRKYLLTSFHCIYLKGYAADRSDIFFAYLLTNTALEIFESNAREYGKGLKKLEPNDLNNSRIINLEKIDEKSERTVMKIYSSYRISVLSGESDNTLSGDLNDLNDIFLKIVKG